MFEHDVIQQSIVTVKCDTSKKFIRLYFLIVYFHAGREEYK